MSDRFKERQAKLRGTEIKDSSPAPCNGESKPQTLQSVKASPEPCYDPDPDLPPNDMRRRAARQFCENAMGCVCRAHRQGRACPPMAAMVEDALAATGLSHEARDLILTGPVAVTRLH